jgi:hypothetical protein
LPCHSRRRTEIRGGPVAVVVKLRLESVALLVRVQ